MGLKDLLGVNDLLDFDRYGNGLGCCIIVTVSGCFYLDLYFISTFLQAFLYRDLSVLLIDCDLLAAFGFRISKLALLLAYRHRLGLRDRLCFFLHFRCLDRGCLSFGFQRICCLCDFI